MDLTLPPLGKTVETGYGPITANHVSAEVITNSNNTYRVRVTVSEDNFNFYTIFTSKPFLIDE